MQLYNDKVSAVAVGLYARTKALTRDTVGNGDACVITKGREHVHATDELPPLLSRRDVPRPRERQRHADDVFPTHELDHPLVGSHAFAVICCVQDQGVFLEAIGPQGSQQAADLLIDFLCERVILAQIRSPAVLIPIPRISVLLTLVRTSTTSSDELRLLRQG